MSRPVQRRRTAKARILDAADDLFYNEGIHAVGIDRVIAQAGVAKGSLYYSFTGKDDLIRAYLAHRHGNWADRIDAGIAAHTDPRDRILAVYDVLGALFAQPDYRGCAFVNATAEAAPDSGEAHAATTFRAWLHDLFHDLATGTDAADPDQLADTLVLLYDGAVATSQMDKTPDPARTARHTAELVLDHAGAQPARPTADQRGRTVEWSVPPMSLSPDEIAYLESQFLGRLATVDGNGAPQNNPVTYRYNAALGTIDIGGNRMATTRKYRNLAGNERVAFVVDDVVSRDPFQPRCLEIRGRAQALSDQDPPLPGMTRDIIRIHPERVFSFGLEQEQPS